MNYSELKTAIAGLLDHSDSDPLIDTWVLMATARINRELRSREMTCRGSAAGDGLTTDFDLPSDWGGARAIEVNGRDVKYRTPEQLADLEVSQNRPTPARYTMIGNKLRIWPPPGEPEEGTKNVVMYYYQKLADLVEDADTNWLLTANPDCYIWLALANGHRHVMDEARAEYYDNLGLGVIDSIEEQNWSDMWSGGVISSTPDFYVP